MPQSSFARRTKLLFYSRSLYRFCNVTCSHVARIADAEGVLTSPAAQSKLKALNRERMEWQRKLSDIADRHVSVCANCEGHCCCGPRERDTFTDRVIQDPETPYRDARRVGGRSCLGCRAQDDASVAVAEAEHVPNACPELTIRGCTLPYELRPIQCVTYFCSAVANALSPEDCAVAGDSVAALMRIEVAAAMLALKLRFNRNARTEAETA